MAPRRNTDKSLNSTTEFLVTRRAKSIVLASLITGLLASSGEPASAVSIYTFQTLDAPDAVLTEALGINGAGQIVGSYFDANATSSTGHGFLLSGGIYTTLDVPGTPVPGTLSYTTPRGINDAGEIAGYYALGSYHGFRLSNGIYTPIDAPGAVNTLVHGINNAGQIVGDSLENSSTRHGFVLSGGIYTPIDAPGAVNTAAHGINDAGQIVGEYHIDNRVHGFLLSDGIYTPIDVPGAMSTTPFGINNVGQIVGYYFDVSNRIYSFLLSDGIYAPIEVPGASFTQAFGINDAGQIVGFYGDTNQRGHGFLATPAPVPEPTTFTLICAGILGLLGCRWLCHRKAGQRSEPGSLRSSDFSAIRYSNQEPHAIQLATRTGCFVATATGFSLIVTWSILPVNSKGNS
jgi:uncharacterized membrane protein